MRWTLVLALTLIVTSAGCLQGVPGVADDGDAGRDGPGTGPPNAASGAAVDDALSELRGNGTEVPRFSIRSTVEVTNATGATTTTTAAVLVDPSAGIALSTLGTDGPDLGGGVDASTYHTARVGTILLMGPPTSIASVRNSSLPPVEGLDALSPATSAPQPSGLTDPARLLDLLASAPPEARDATGSVEHDGRTVTEVRVDHETVPGRVQARLLLDMDTGRLLLAEGTTEGRVHGNGTQPETTRFHLTFSYGAEATHPHQTALLRAASLTILTPDRLPGGAESTWSGTSRTWTMQPSPSPGLVTLEEATALVVNRTSDGSLTTHITLPLEDEEAAGDGFHLTFEDADGDGHVSPGDTLTLTRDGNATAELHLLDEVTGLRLVPGPGTLLLLAAAGALGILRRYPEGRTEPLK